MRNFYFLLCLIMLNSQLYSQSNNFKAQGYYYKAKELFLAKNYSAAIPYLDKSRESLAGSNQLIQYIYVMCYVNIQDWVNAQKELSLYFDLEENKVKAVYFSENVERLTGDETKDLSKAMVDIEEKSDYAQSDLGKAEALRKTNEEKINFLREKIKGDFQRLISNYSKKIGPNNQSASIKTLDIYLNFSNDGIEYSRTFKERDSRVGNLYVNMRSESYESGYMHYENITNISFSEDYYLAYRGGERFEQGKCVIISSNENNAS